MTEESMAGNARGVPRRSVTRTAAWSVPVVTTALAAPALAASLSETIDLSMEARPYGDAMRAFNEDKSRGYEIVASAGFDARNLGTEAVSGAVVTVSFDTRLMSNPQLEVDGTVQSPAETRTEGNLVIATFPLPDELPVGGSVGLSPRLERAEPIPWHEDVEPYAIKISPPTGLVDANPGNNDVTMEPTYYDTHDAAVTATWARHELTASGGGTVPVYVHDTVTVTADAPGDVPTDGGFSVHSPQALIGSEDVPIYEDVRIVSAMLDGQDVASAFEVDFVTDGGQYMWIVKNPIEVGQELVVKVAVDVTSDTVDSVSSEARAAYYTNYDRDFDNDSTYAPELT